MEGQIVSDIIEWDTINWAKFLDFIDGAKMDFQGKQVLALGERNGGISLFFALKGAVVLCSDLDGPKDKAHALHKKYGVDSQVQYAAINATQIPEKYNEQFDIVTFKSVFGGIGGHDSYDNQGKCVDSIYRVLRPGGYVFFAENMKATWWHMALRKAFRPTGGYWHFETHEELCAMFWKFHLIATSKVGFIGTLGRTEGQRRAMGKLDTWLFDPILPDSMKYIGMYIFQKRED